MVSIQSKHLSENDVKQLASLLPFITSSQSSADPREQAMKVAEEIDRLVAELDLKTTLREYKIPQTDFEDIIERALPDGKQDARYREFVELLQSIH